MTLILVSNRYESLDEPSTHEIEILPKTGNEYKVFVSSKTYTGMLGGLVGADAICTTLAHDSSGGSLGGGWAAWLSTSSADAIDRIADVEYYLVDGSELVADGVSDISSDGKLEHSINMDENEVEIDDGETGNVQTGTDNDGEGGSGDSSNCKNWSNATVTYGRMLGDSESVDSWSFDSSGDTCADKKRIYCFEVDKDDDGSHFKDDCDDRNETVYPGAPEICDGLDNDCNGSVPANEKDIDGDDYRVCDGDCNDNDSLIYPGAAERCNGEDDNCDGTIPVGEKDQDGDGFMGCEGDCKDKDNTIYPGAKEVCDGKDNDCDGKVDENLNKPCGTNTGICTVGFEICVAGEWGNCSGVQPQNEVCDGLDNDCDSSIDEGCSCDSGTTQSCGSDTGICAIGTQWCEGGSWGGCIGSVGPSTEICDEQDNDCDGSVDENLKKSCGTDIGECKSGTAKCVDGSWEGCSGAVNSEDEKCDEKDNDCDGTVDEGCKCSSGKERSCGVSEGICENGTQKCVEGRWSECEGSIDPSEEICDETDNDCDGEVDEDLICEEEKVEETPEIKKKIDFGGFFGGVFDRVKQYFKDLADNAFTIRAIPIVASIGASGVLIFYVYRKYKIAKRENAAKKFKESQGYVKTPENESTRKSPLS
ncbi:MAG: putative metal-binding motif-containing protein [Patescibacteria group bacterium]|nr:putative metal-binding motif-containing protein [Patescibacteria group bacterium]